METLDLVSKAYALGMIQMREEISALVDLVRSIQPKNIMEIGSETGGTFYLWCQLTALGGLKVSLDLPSGASGSGQFDNPRALAARCDLFRSWSPRVRVITGDSHNPEIRHQVLRALDGELLDFLFIDGDHSYLGVKADWKDYRSLVRPGGLVAFHDIRDCEHHRIRGCFVHDFWLELEGAKRELVDPDGYWGGIGVLEV
jgi:cephalosporin hydroxylase